MAKKAETTETTGINLQVPNDLYDSIAEKAKKDSRKNGAKKSIASKMIELLEVGNNVQPGKKK